MKTKSNLPRKKQTKKLRKRMTTETSSQAQAKKFNKTQFEKEAGLPKNSIYNYINSGALPKKKEYSQDDIETFLKKRGTVTERNKPGRSRKNKTDKKNNYTHAQVASMLGYKLEDLRRLNVMPAKEQCTDEDVKQIKALLHSKKVPAPTSTPAKLPDYFSNDFDPFEILDNVNPNAQRSILISKLIDWMKKIKSGSAAGVKVPAMAFTTPSRAAQAITEAKAIISKQKGYEDISWKMSHKKNEGNQYTHTLVWREN